MFLNSVFYCSHFSVVVNDPGNVVANVAIKAAMAYLKQKHGHFANMSSVEVQGSDLTVTTQKGLKYQKY